MRHLYLWLDRSLFHGRPLQFRLNVIFGLFFFGPVLVMIYFGVRYHLLTDHHLPLFLLGLLALSLFGLNMLRKVFDDIGDFSRQMTMRLKNDTGGPRLDEKHRDELQQLRQSCTLLTGRLEDMQHELARHHARVGIVRELAELCYVTADPDEIMYLVLERALSLTGSDIGSVLMLEKGGRSCFVVRACIGLDQKIRINDRIDFETSIARYAVLNKAPLIVDNVEQDVRFSRTNRSQYGTKAFACLPIKTSREIIGVLTLSRSKESATLYDKEQLRILEPMVSNAAFAYENLLLHRGSEAHRRCLEAIAAMVEMIISGFHDSEMLASCLNEIRSAVNFRQAYVLKRDPNRPQELLLIEALAAGAPQAARGRHFPLVEGGCFDRCLQQRLPVILPADEIRGRDSQLQLLGEFDDTVVIVPLKLGGTSDGLLALSLPDGYSPEIDLPFMQLSAGCLAMAIEHANLYESVAKRNRELESIKQIGSALASSTFDIKQVLDYTMDMIRLIMDVDSGTLYLVQGGMLEFAASFDADEGGRKPVHLRLGEGIPGYVAARGEKMMINENRDVSLFMPALSSEGMRSALCVPMISQAKVIGVIEVLNKRSGDFGPSDADLLQSIAASVSIAIENANLYKETVAMAESERGLRRLFQKFVPKAVLDKILHGGGIEMVEELKTLTLINLDIRGFSSLSKTLGPQKTVALLNAFFSLMGGIVFKHHGIVDKYLGDGFLAIFGAPVSSVSDADNAAAAALEMQACLGKINSGLAAEMGAELKIGISIHTGEVVVGNIGFEMKMDYTVIGDSVNEVFRLQDLVRPYPNRILVSEKTMRAARIPLACHETEHCLGDVRIFELVGTDN